MQKRQGHGKRLDILDEIYNHADEDQRLVKEGYDVTALELVEHHGSILQDKSKDIRMSECAKKMLLLSAGFLMKHLIVHLS